MVTFRTAVQLAWDKTFMSGTQPCSLSYRINVAFALTFGSLLSRALSKLGSRRSRSWESESVIGLNMSTQYRLIRALRYATLAVFFAAGLKRVFLPNVGPVKITLARSSR